MNWTYDYDYDLIPLSYARQFKDLPRKIKQDLLFWLNRDKPSDKETNKLFELYQTNNFKAWNCPNCGARIYRGWPIFQDTIDQDLSISGNTHKYQPGFLDACCDNCREFLLQ